MHPDGRDRKSCTFANVANVFKEFIPKGEDPFRYCAGYNFYLRPAKEMESIKDKPINRKIAAKTLRKVIDILNPEYVVFLSKKSYGVFKKKCNLGGAQQEEGEHVAVLRDLLVTTTNMQRSINTHSTKTRTILSGIFLLV